MTGTTNDYMPRRDADFATWAENFMKQLHAFFDNAGLDKDMLVPLDDAQAVFDAAYPAHVAAMAAAEAARQDKDAARGAFERQIRPIVRYVQSVQETTDADRALMGITVKQGLRAVGGGPNGKPRATVRAAQRLAHVLRIADDATPERRGKPKGVLGAEVFVAVTPAGTPAPSDPHSYRYLTLATGGAARAEFTSEDSGHSAHYQVRWVGTKGQRGPWSAITTATIAA